MQYGVCYRCNTANGGKTANRQRAISTATANTNVRCNGGNTAAHSSSVGDVQIRQYGNSRSINAIQRTAQTAAYGAYGCTGGMYGARQTAINHGQRRTAARVVQTAYVRSIGGGGRTIMYGANQLGMDVCCLAWLAWPDLTQSMMVRQKQA